MLYCITRVNAKVMLRVYSIYSTGVDFLLSGGWGVSHHRYETGILEDLALLMCVSDGDHSTGTITSGGSFVTVPV